MKVKKRISLLLSISLFLLLVIAVFLIPHTSKGVERDLDQIEKSGILHVATSFDPIGYFVSGDTLAGFNYELLKALEKYTKIKFEVVSCKYTQRQLRRFSGG